MNTQQDLKNYPGQIIEKTNRRGWVYWLKHHAMALAIILAGVLFIVGFIYGKSSIIIFDNTPRPAITLGIKQLHYQEFPSAYKYKDPMQVGIYCIDGVKLVVFDEGLSSQIIGGCE